MYRQQQAISERDMYAITSTKPELHFAPLNSHVVDPGFSIEQNRKFIYSLVLEIIGTSILLDKSRC